MLLAEADVCEYLVPDELNDGGDVAGYVGAGDVAGVWLSDVVVAKEVFVGIGKVATRVNISPRSLDAYSGRWDNHVD